jgi:hypothetical protein
MPRPSEEKVEPRFIMLPPDGLGSASGNRATSQRLPLRQGAEDQTMSTATDSRIALSDIRLKHLKLHAVPLRRALPRRGRGRYDSGETLPSTTALLERTLIQIISIYEERAGAKESFEQRWQGAIEKLREFGDATSYRVWKEERAHPESELQEFLRDLRASTGGTPVPKKADHGEWLKKATQEVTDIAIGYWIEARNALDSGEEPRALHAMIECHYFIGIINSPLTHSEAMRAQGGKQGRTKRQAVEQVAKQTLASLLEGRSRGTEAPSFSSKLEMMSAVADKMLMAAEHKSIIDAYDKQAVQGRGASEDQKFRLTRTLLRWASSEAKKHPEFSDLSNKASRLLCNRSPKKKYHVKAIACFLRSFLFCVA